MFLSSRVNLHGFSYFDDAYKVALKKVFEIGHICTIMSGNVGDSD